jgi:hypothetical protein
MMTAEEIDTRRTRRGTSSMSIDTTPAEPRTRRPAPSRKPPAAEVPAARPRGRPGKVLDAIKGDPPNMRYIHKSQLVLDPSYQRSANGRKVDRIARHWDWHAFGALHVARRADGRFLVFEGGHRLLAACRREEIQEVPCLVHPSRGAKDEAGSFLTVNTDRAPLSGLDRFRAQVTSEDELAVLAKRLIDEAGYTLSSSPNELARETKVIGSLIKYLRRNREATLRAWPVVVEVAAGRAIHQRVLSSIWYVEHHLTGTGVSLADEPWRSSLVRHGSPGIMDKTARAAGYHGSGGETVWGEALVDLLNLGRRRNKLVLPGFKGDRGRREGGGLGNGQAGAPGTDAASDDEDDAAPSPPEIARQAAVYRERKLQALRQTKGPPLSARGPGRSGMPYRLGL